MRSTDAIILCGGKGTRLQSVLRDAPKSLAPIAGRPFLDWLFDYILPHHFGKIILAVGHLAEPIIERYGNNDRLIFSRETEPLGTGGALKQAMNRTNAEHVMVLNGDSLCPVDLTAFHAFHLQKDSLASIVLSPVAERSDAGNVSIDAEQRITSYQEKNSFEKASHISAGIYLFKRAIQEHFPSEKTFSLEYDLIPKILHQSCYGFPIDEEVLDIGTPERFQKANTMFESRRK